MLTISVMIPTYHRPQDLARCLSALETQNRQADEIVVVVRDTDVETWQFLHEFDASRLPLRQVTVTVPGQVAALNAGLCAVQGDIIAITDDDAAPNSDWLERIEAHFLADDRVGGVGGRDIIQTNEPWNQREQQTVGKLTWYGKIIGNHHIGIGFAREVDILKGVNMSYRRSALIDHAFDSQLLGIGAQVHNEVAFCLALRKMQWTLIYDPAILVDHYSAPRFDEDQRHQFNAIAHANAAHNETLALLKNLPFVQRCIFLVWAVLVGTSQAFGLVQWLRYLPSQGTVATQKLGATLQGRWQGLVTWLQTKNQPVNRASDRAEETS